MVTFAFRVTMVTNIIIAFLVTVMTLVTRVSNVLMVTYAFGVTMVTNITIDLLLTVMTFITRVCFQVYHGYQHYH